MGRTMKANMLRLAVLALALVMLLGMLPATTFAAETETASATTTIKPVADAYVSYANHTTNYGTADTLLVDGSVTDEKIAFLSYESWPFSGVEDATLNLPMEAGNISVYLIDDYLIDEYKLNWANMPSLKSAKKLATVAADGALTVDLSGETFAGNYFTIVVRADQPNRIYEENFNDVPLQSTTIVKAKSGTNYAVLFQGEEKQETLDEQIYSEKLLCIARGNGSTTISNTYDVVAGKENAELGRSVKASISKEIVLYNSLKDSNLDSSDLTRSFKIYYRVYTDTTSNSAKAAIYVNSATGSKKWKVSPETTIGAWTALSAAVTLDNDNVSGQQGMISICYGVEAQKSNYYYLDDIFVVETTSGKAWNSVSASFGSKEGTDFATVSVAGVLGATAFRPVSETYVSPEAPDTAFGATELAKLEIGNGNIALVTFDISKYRGCESLDLILPVSGEVKVSLMEYQMDAATFTYNTYKSLSVAKTDMGIVKGGETKIDLADFVSAMSSNYLTVVMESLDYYEQDFEAITSRAVASGSPKCVANEDGTITNWGANLVYSDESQGVFSYKYGGAGNPDSMVLETVDGNQYMKLVGHTGSATYAAEVKVHNLLGLRQMRAEDVGKTYRISFDMKSNQTAEPLKIAVKTPDDVYAADGTTSLHARTTNMLEPMPSFTVETAETWKSYTFDVTLTSEMVKWQGVIDFAFNIPNRDGTLSNYFAVDNLKSTLVGGEFSLSLDGAAVLHEHKYDKKAMNADTFVAEGEDDTAIYYYSCACGAVGTETFTGSHVHTPGAAATATTPQLCAECDAMMAPPTDPTITTRYKIGDETKWTYGTFKAAMTAANGKTATVELLADDTISSLVTLNGGTISITSIRCAFEDGKAFELSRALTFTTDSLFSIYGGAKVTITNVVFNGKSIESTKKNTEDGGGIFRLSGTGTILDATGVKLINSNLKNTSKYYGGAVYVKLGATFNLTNGEIRNCTSQRGPGVFVHNTNSTFNMTDSLIEGCYTAGTTGHGAAVALYGSGTFNMSGGLIINNTSTREDMPTDYFATRAGIYIDGAVGISSTGNKVTLSGDAIIRNNTAKKISDDGKGTRVVVNDSGVIGFQKGDFKAANMIVNSDFTGSVAYGHFEYVNDNVQIATPSGTWENSETIVNGFIDNHYVSISDPRAIRVGKLVDGKLVWVKAQAEVDVDGKITRYATYADAYAVVGNKTPIKLLADVQIGNDMIEAPGDTVKIITNGYKVTFLDDIQCGIPSTVTETVGAFTAYGYTYEGYDAEVTTYTATYVPHEHRFGAEATATTAQMCEVRYCGAIKAYPTDETLNTRYSLDNGATWIFTTFADAMSKVNGQTAIVEFFRDITVTAGTDITSGNVVIRSVPADENFVETDKIFTLLRDASFKNAPMFTVSGGANVEFDDVVLDGAGIGLSDVNGTLIKVASNSGINTVVNISDGVTLMNANGGASGLGGAFHVSGGSTVNMTGGLIKNCKAKNGAALYLKSDYSDQFATFNMSGGLITECEATNNKEDNYGQASAIMLYSSARVNMSGGMIAGNKSFRNNIQEPKGTINGSIVDGAITFLRDNENHLTLSGDAIIRNNGGFRNVDETLVWDEDSANVTFFRDYVTDAANCITVKSDFTGSVGIAWPGSVESTEERTVVVGNFGGYTSADEGKVITGIFDDNCDSRVAIVKDGKLYWANATAQLDLDGKINRYVKFDEAYAIVGNTKPITLIGNATVTLDEFGDTVKVVENGYTIKAIFEGGLEAKSTEKAMIGAFAFESFEFPGVEKDVTTFETVEGGSIFNISGLVGTDLSMRFYTFLGDDYVGAFLRVTRNGKIVELTVPKYDDAKGQYYFTYTGIAPQCIGDVLTAELVHGEEVLDTVSNYSLLKYYKTLLSMNKDSLGLTEEKDTELKTLLRDLLAYGAAAQKYTDYNTDALVNEGYTASEFIPMGATTRKITVNNKVDGYSFKSAGLRFANVNNLYFKFTTPDVANTKLVVNGETKTEFTKSGTSYAYFTEDLYATDFDKLFTVELYAGETLVQTLTYSVSAYVHSMIDHADDTVKELAIATYNYGLAARVYTERLVEESYTVPSMQSAAIVLGGATVDGTALTVDKPAAGVEFAFAFRSVGNIKLNITAEADARLEITVDGNYKIEHYLVSAGTADYELPLELKGGKHTVRIVQETGSFKINSVKYKGYPAMLDAKDLYIEFVGDELLAGRYMYLNPNVAIDDASAAYAFLTASELDAQYLISSTSKYLTTAVANTNVPALVVIDYQEGSSIDYATIVANVKATYGDDVNILFAAGAMNTPNTDTLSALGASVILTTDNSGYEAYPSKGASALNGAELAKYIRENYDFFTAEQVSSASKDMILAVDKVSNGYNTFHVYVKTSDPSDNIYIRYNFIYEYDDRRSSFTENTTTNISNFRVKTADLVEVTEITETAVTATIIKQVLQMGEISAALKTVNAAGTKAADFTGGYHGDERLTYVKLVADGKEVTIENGTACVLTCNSVVFDQHAMMYEHRTSTADSYGTELTTHNQHFVITRESGVNNRQSLEWQKDIQIVPENMYLQMFTLNRYKDGYDVCDILETYNADGRRFGKVYEAGPRTSAYSVLSSTTNRATKYGATTSGISAYTTYDSCNVGTFADNKLINNSYSISVRTQGDNKLYVNFKSSVGNNWVAEGEKWIIDVAYGADYIAPNN